MRKCDREDCVFTGLFLALLVVIFVNGCVNNPASISNTATDSKMWYCLGACAYADSEVDRVRVVIEDDDPDAELKQEAAKQYVIDSIKEDKEKDEK